MIATLDERQRGIYAKLITCATNLAHSKENETVALLGFSRQIYRLCPEPALADQIAALERACGVRSGPGVPAMFIFGDSHTPAMFGRRPAIHAIHCGPRTMHGVARDGLDFLQLESFGVEDGDEVAFQFGEIDARIHIGRQRERGRAPDGVIGALVDAYVAAIDAKVAAYRSLGVTVLGAVPPVRDANLIPDSMQPVGSFEDRVGYTLQLNERLRVASTARGYRFLDLNHLYADSDGAVPPEITIDGVHIGSAARFLAVRALGVLAGRLL